MRAETNDGHPLVGIRRDRRVDVAMVVEMGVADSHRLQLVREQAAQVFLFFGGWAGRRSRVRLGVDDHIAQKALGHCMRELDRRSHSQKTAARKDKGRISYWSEKRHSGGRASRAGMTPSQS